MNKENIRRRIRNVTAFAAALLLAAAFTFPSGTEIMGISFGNAIVASAAQVASGTMSNSLKWVLDDAGTLTISYTGSGSGGSMKNWTNSDYWQGKIPWFKYKDNIKSVVIGDKVTSIGNYAFYRCSNITSVDMGSVTSIGESAFEDCRSLSSITIPDSVTSIGESAFYECTSLSSITIPDSVTSLGGNVFLGCTSLSSVSFGESPKLTSIGIQTFWGCESLTSINIPGSVTSIAIDAFKNCTSLASITVDENSSNYSAESGVLFNKDKTALILYPANKSDTSYAIPSSVSSIGDNAFFDCIGFESISIPESVTSIGVNAFYGCKSLKSVTIPGSVTSIGYGTFIGCTSLSEVTISDGVTSTGVETFKGCTSLSDITIPNSVTSIGDRAFNNCTSLSDITIPGSVASIGGGAFEGCEKLESIAIPDSIDSIENDTFKNCTGLASITIPGSVDSIGDSAFEGCTGLKSITIPNSVTSIGYSAFEGCTGLKSITIPNSVTSIGYGTFIGCTSLSSITIPNSVTSIGDQAFESCSSLESITIPDSVTSIGESAFESCSSLTSITIPDSVNSIGNRTFYKCTSLTSITIPDSVNSIGDLAFYECSSLTSITIPSSVNSIGELAFSECSSLTSITIPDSVNSIGNFAFESCEKLESIFLPESLSEIAEYAIPETAAQIKYSDDGVDNITITSVTLGEGQTSLTISETIGGKTVTSIGNNALADCSNLESIIIPKDIDITNAGIPSSATQIRYTVDNENVTITAVTLGGEATGFVLPDKIGGKAVTNIANGALASCPDVEHTHREKTAATCTEKAVCAICETEYGETEAHNLNKHDAVPVSCTTDGNIEYYECNVCGKLFADENGEKETTLEAVMISAIGHSISHVYAKDPTCTEDGNNEHYKCSVCNMLFEDANGTTETTLDDVTIPAIGHNFGIACDSNAGGHYYVCTVCDEKSDIEEHIKDNGTVIKEATPTENGTITYKCIVCGAKAGEETITATISSFEVTSSGVVVKYTVTGSTEVKSQTLKFSEVTEEMVELMKSKNIKLVIDFVNYSTAGSDTIILTSAQMKAIDYVLAHDFVIES